MIRKSFFATFFFFVLSTGLAQQPGVAGNRESNLQDNNLESPAAEAASQLKMFQGGPPPGLQKKAEDIMKARGIEPMRSSSEKAAAELFAPEPSGLTPVPLLKNEGFVYDPMTSRDPFKMFQGARPAQPGIAPKQRTDQPASDSLLGYDIDQFELMGIIWSVKDPKALLRTPKGTTFFVRKRTKVGRSEGYVAAIREGEVVVIELSEDGQTYVPRVLALGSKSSSQGGAAVTGLNPAEGGVPSFQNPQNAVESEPNGAPQVVPNMQPEGSPQ